MSLDERVMARVRTMRPKSAMKSAAAVPFYVVGWAFGAVFFVLSWGWAAITVGFTDGRGTRHREGGGGE